MTKITENDLSGFYRQAHRKNRHQHSVFFGTYIDVYDIAQAVEDGFQNLTGL